MRIASQHRFATSAISMVRPRRRRRYRDHKNGKVENGGRPGFPQASADPIYAAIESHQAAFRDHVEAVRAEFAYEEYSVVMRNMNAEQRAAYAVLERAASAAFDRMKELSVALVTTKPTTLAGIGAVRHTSTRFWRKGRLASR